MPTSNDKHLQEVNQEIYKRNAELAIVNKTLTLLRKLYQISLLALKPATLSEKISKTVMENLNMGMVGVFLFEEETDTLVPLNFSTSDRLKTMLEKSNGNFLSKKISNINNSVLFKKTIYNKTKTLNATLTDIWGSNVDTKILNNISVGSHVTTVLVYPLVTKNKSIGALVFGLNRNFNTLNKHEQESLNSLVDVVAVALDNTLLYKKLGETNDQLIQLDKARAEFISIASHQLRTPPATIKWYLAAVLDGDYGKLTPKTAEALVKAQLTNNNLIGLIDDMLNASRIERGKMEFLFEYADFEKITSQIVDQLQPQAGFKKLKLIYKKPKGKMPEILADKEKLSQVVNNLVDNAIKYTKTGTVRVELTKTDADLILKVKDSGKGLSANETSSIFEKYGRGKDSKQLSSGLGLGLYVAKIIAEHHEGKIWAESDGPGKGTTFICKLPIKTDLKAEEFDLAQPLTPSSK